MQLALHPGKETIPWLRILFTSHSTKHPAIDTEINQTPARISIGGNIGIPGKQSSPLQTAQQKARCAPPSSVFLLNALHCFIYHCTFLSQTVLLCTFLRRLADTKLLLLDPREHTNKNEQRQNDGGPRLDLQDVFVIIGASCITHRDQQKHQNQIPTVPMVLPDGLGTAFATVQLGRSPHGEAYKVLQQNDNCADNAEIAMGGVEMLAMAGLLVVLNDGHASHQREESKEVERCVDALRNSFLFWRVRRLERENRLD